MAGADASSATAQPSARVATWGVVSSIVAAALAYVLQVAIGGAMLPASFSETQSLLGLYMMLSMPAVPVLLLITRRIVQDHQQAVLAGTEPATYVLVHALLWRITVGGGALCAAALILRAPVATALGVSMPAAVPWFALAVVTNLVFLVAHAALLGLFRWRAAVGLPVVLGAARLVCSYLFVIAGYGVAGVFAAIVASNAVCFVVAYALSMPGLPRAGRYTPLRLDEVGLAAILNAAFWFLVHVDTVYVNAHLPLAASAGYAAAATLARPVVYFPNAVNQMLFPFLTAAASPAIRRRVLAQMTAAAIALGAAALIAFAVAPRLILGLTFGPAYFEAAPLLPRLGAVLVPFALMNVVLYDALARHDRPMGIVFAAVALAVAAGLAVAQPALPGLFAMLIAGAIAGAAVGAFRLRSTVRA